MIITIDGKAATKKSPVAYLLAKKTGFRHISSGLVYRAVGAIAEEVAASNNSIFGSKFREIISQLKFCDEKIEWLGSAIERHHDGKVKRFTEEELTCPKTTERASEVSSNSIVREAVLTLLRNEIKDHDVVADGRDMGTEVFPEADLKFFFESTFEKRASWRHKYEGEKHGETLEQVMIGLKKRDADSFWISAANDATTVRVGEESVHEIADVLFKNYFLPLRFSEIGTPLSNEED